MTLSLWFLLSRLQKLSNWKSNQESLFTSIKAACLNIMTSDRQHTLILSSQWLLLSVMTNAMEIHTEIRHSMEEIALPKFPTKIF